MHQVRNKEGKKQKHYKLCLDILQCEADTSFESIVTSGDVSNHSQFFFETNQAGELPIILERRNNTQTEHNNETDQLDWDINTTTQLHSNSTQ